MARYKERVKSAQVIDQERAQSPEDIEKAFDFPLDFGLKSKLSAPIQRYCVNAKSRLTPVHEKEYSEIATAATLLADFLEDRKDNAEAYSEIHRAIVAVPLLAFGGLNIDDLAALQASVPKIRALAAAASRTHEAMGKDRGGKPKDQALHKFLRDLLKIYAEGTKNKPPTVWRGDDGYTGPLFRFVKACMSIADLASGAEPVREDSALGKALERARNNLRLNPPKRAETKGGPPPGWPK